MHIHEEFQSGNYLCVVQCHKTGLQTLECLLGNDKHNIK